jgi:hypothetical protein
MIPKIITIASSHSRSVIFDMERGETSVTNVVEQWADSSFTICLTNPVPREKKKIRAL